MSTEPRAAAWPTSALQRWFYRRLPDDPGEVLLHRGRIYIVPTRQGYGFAGVVLLIVLGAMNYGTSLGFFAAFLLAGIGLMSILHCFRNLHGLRISIAPREPVFAGQRAHFGVRLNNPGARSHYMVDVTIAGTQAALDVVPGVSNRSVELPVEATRRGRLEPGPVRVSTRFPLGLVVAWTWLKPVVSCIVYPAPLGGGKPLPYTALSDGTGHSLSTDNEDFFGFRDYRPGDPLRHIAWRTLARGAPLQTKEFAGESGGDLVLRWNDAPQADSEGKLSQLCAWVLQAHALGVRYAVEIPGTQSRAGRGERHRHRCLELLALY